MRWLLAMVLVGCGTAASGPAPVPSAAPAAAAVAQADTPCPAGYASFGQSGCWLGDPCGRQPGYDAEPTCGTFSVPNGADRGDVTVTCGACPMGGQCGGPTFGADKWNLNAPYCPPAAAPYQCPSDHWCFQPCQPGQSGLVPGVSPTGRFWGVQIQCP